MMRSFVLFLAAAGLALTTACQNFEKGPGGLEYKIVKDAGNEKAVEGDFLAVDLTVTTDRDSLLSSTYDLNLPQIVNIAPDSIPGIYPGDYNSMFKYLGEGDSAVFHLDMDTLAAQTGQPKLEFVDKHMTFTVNVRKHFKKGDLTDSVFFAQIDDYYKEILEELKNKEESNLNDYIAKNKLEPQKTASGLQYVIEEEGNGELPQEGDTVVVNYVGRLMNGKVFDTNDEDLAKKENVHNPMRPYEPIRFRIGHDPVIQGWTEGLKLVSKGGKARLIVPSELGYGERGGGIIPPYAPLVFQVELLEIIPSQDEAEEITEEPADNAESN